MKRLNGARHPAVSQSRRVLVTLACTTAITNSPAQTIKITSSSDVGSLARELGMGGWKMRQVAAKLLMALGREVTDCECAALLTRLRSTGMQLSARADAARMWIRDDFAHGRLIEVEDVRFARTEVALLVSLLD